MCQGVGAFANAVEAAFAYDEAAKAMCGYRARLNFPAGCSVTTSSGTCAEATPSGSDSTTTFNHSGVSAAEEIDVKPLIPNLLPMVVQIRKAPAIGSKKGCMKGKGGPENSRCDYRGVRQRTGGKWVAEIRQPNKEKKRLWLQLKLRLLMIKLQRQCMVLVPASIFLLVNQSPLRQELVRKQHHQVLILQPHSTTPGSVQPKK